MCDLRTVLAACCLLIVAAGTGAADDMEFRVTVKGICQAQVPIAGWDQCQEAAKYTSFKGGKYTFEFSDKKNNVYILSGTKDRQLDATNLYSNIDTIVSTVGGQKTVDSQVMNIAAAKKATARSVSLPVFSRSWRIGVGRTNTLPGPT